MLADTSGNHPVLTGARSSSSAKASPATQAYLIIRPVYIMDTMSAYLTLDIRNSVRGERKFIQRNLRFLEVPKEAELAL